jgi:hypothetical protein
MDVYSADQTRYIGSVVAVRRADQPHSPRGGSAPESGSADQAAHGNPALVHEEDASVSPNIHRGKRQLGEEMGPFPTLAVGNTGPTNQSASQAYATEPRQAAPDVVSFVVRPGRINLGPLTRPLYIPTSAVRSVSMERVVLDLPGDEIPKEWRRR